MESIVLHGRAWVFGDQLDSDRQICSLERVTELRSQGMPLVPEELGKLCLGGVDPTFSERVQPGDFIVAGENTGYAGSCLDCQVDDPHYLGIASMAIRGAGVAAVLCESSNANFLMTSVNLGLPVVECRGLRQKVRQGDQLRVDLAAGSIANLTTGDELRFIPFPEPLLDRISQGGLYAQLREFVKKTGETR